MNIQDIYELMSRFEASSIGELKLNMEGVKVAFKKGGQAAAVPAVTWTETTAVQKKEKKNDTSGTAVEAPLVGTFYQAPSPEEAPFVTVGQKVKKGDVVGIIEAMKLMNEITAPCDGIIETIDAENGQMVEFHQVLIRIS